VTDSTISKAFPRRDERLQAFLTSVAEAFAVRAIGENAEAAIKRIYGALATPRLPSKRAAQRLPVCVHLAEALAIGRAHSPPLARIADDFSALEALLYWAPRAASGPFASHNWPDGHANAMIIGPTGLEIRGDVQIGVSLLAPHVRYPDHNHEPEEVYFLLSPGRFQHGGSQWFEPGVGGTLYNEPNIKHAMASDDVPLLAIWCLWTGKEPMRPAANG
jgi:quercetin dioxygenase-like cupin family protein